MPHRSPLARSVPSIWMNVLVAFVIWGSGELSRRYLVFGDFRLPLLWMPSGLALGFLLRKRLELLPGVVVGVVWTSLGGGWAAALTEAVHGLTECAVVYVLLRRKRWDAGFGRAVDVASFALVGVGVAPLAAWGAETVVQWVLRQPMGFGTREWAEVMAHMSAIGLLVPAITLYRREEWARMRTRTKALLISVLVGGPLAVELEVFSRIHPATQGYPLALLPFPIAAWLVFSVSLSVAIQCLVLMGLALALGTASGHGYFVSSHPIQTVLSFNGFLSLLGVSTLMMGALYRHRLRAEALSTAAMEQSNLCLWEWRAGVGLVIQDPAWAARFRAMNGEPIDPELLEQYVVSENELSFLCRIDEKPELREGETEAFRLQLHDGSWIELVSRRLRNPPAYSETTYTLHGVFQDVTETREAEKAKQEALLREAQLKNLKMSLHPHFLFNSLNTLRALIATRPEEARNFVTMLATFLRSTIAPAEEDLVRLGTELEIVMNYLRMEQYRFGERLRVRNEVPGALLREKFPPMLLQTLVENAAKYGIAKRAEGGEIVLSASKADGLLVVSVINDGPLVKTPEGATGTGLRTSQQRLDLVFGEGAAKLELRELPGPRVEARVVIMVDA